MSDPLVTVDWLCERLDDEAIAIADVRWSLQGDGREAYRQGHIDGAYFVDLEEELSSPLLPSLDRASGQRASRAGGRHPLPSLAQLARLLSRLGVGRGDTVVAYDDAGGATAARLWWLLRWVGLDGRVLDGGIQAWQAAGGQLTTAVPPDGGAPALELQVVPGRVVNADEVEQLRTQPGVVLLDARSADRFRGTHEPVDARAGHIPGATNAPYAGNLDAQNGRFLGVEGLRQRYALLGADVAERVICYCGSGVTACHNLMALARVGRAAQLYPGSWSEWSSDPSRPTATGDD